MKARNLAYLNHKTILLVTEAIYGSGDFFAAKKFIQQLNQVADNIHIYWYVIAGKSRADVNDKVAAATTHEFDANVSIILAKQGQNLVTNECERCDLILFFPTVHTLSLFDYDHLRTYKVPVVQVHEYDGDHENHEVLFRSELTAVDTGFNGLGLFFENIQLSTLQQPLHYDAERVTFFSYVNQDINNVINDVTIHKFLQLAFAIVDADKSIDLIANSSFSTVDSDFFDLIWSHEFSEIKFITKDKDGNFKEQVMRSPRQDSTYKQLRLINSFPLSNNEMLGAMSIAHPLIQVTGDQSLSEVMSMASLNKGMFPFYQIMSWKNILYQHWLETAIACLGANSHYVTLLQTLRKGNELDINKFAEIWRMHESEILADSLRLSAFLAQEKNLTRNFPEFLDHLFYINTNFPETDFRYYCELAVQLTTKLGDSQGVRDLLHSMGNIADVIRRKNHIMTLTEFLTLNVAPMTSMVLANVSQQLLAMKDDDALQTAITLRKILTLLPAQSRSKYVERILTDLAKASSAVYPQILEEMQKFKHFDMIDKDDQWFSCVVAMHIKQDKLYAQGGVKLNSILLAVNVYSDGVGDTVKFIGVYHLLRRLLPTTNITCLIHCFDKTRPTLLAMLRENEIPLPNTYLCSFSNTDKVFGTVGLEGQAAQIKYAQIGFEFHSFSLAISVATPFRDILRHSSINMPYIDIAEVEAVSYLDPALRHKQDIHHHFAMMGITHNAVGIEIAEPDHRTTVEVLASLTPSLHTKLLDGHENLPDNTFFMPAYVKKDKGYLSLFFMLKLLASTHAEVTTAIIWMYDLPCELHTSQLQNILRDAGFSEIIYYNAEGMRSVIEVDCPRKKRQLRIITGRIEARDYNSLHQLARYTGGFAGCSGQNSFEVCVSKGLLPAFCAPNWQLPIISQTRSLVATLFPHQSEEYRTLDDYFSMLSSISRTLNQIDKLCSMPLVKPYVRQFENLGLADVVKEIMNISPDMQTLIEEQSPEIIAFDPLEIMTHFFASIDIGLLKKAWGEMCEYIKLHKNLKTWLAHQVNELIPDPSKLTPVLDTFTYKATAHVFTSSAYTYVTAESLPLTYQYIQQFISEICNPRLASLFHFVMTDSDSLLVENVPGQQQATIAISSHAWKRLSVEAMRFGLRLCIALSENYPVESPSFSINRTSQEEILMKIKGDLDGGMSYCREYTAVLEGKDIERKSQQNYYRDMIKAIEMRLAALHKHQLQSTLFKRKLARFPESILVEIALLQKGWSVISQHAAADENRSTLEKLSALLKEIPGLRIRNIQEYEYPRRQTTQFLEQFKKIEIDIDDNDEVNAVIALVDCAYEHNAAVFNKLYTAACGKISYDGQLLPLGPYKKLLDMLRAFVTSTTPARATQHAIAIETYLNTRSTKCLFNDSAKLISIFIDYLDNFQHQDPDAILFSTVGVRIRWLDFLRITPEFDKCISTLHTWASSTRSVEISKVLFRLGYATDKRLWDILPYEFFLDMLKGTRSIILDAPVHDYIERNHYCKCCDITNKFRKDYLYHLYHRDVQPPRLPLSKAHIEAFILSNQNTLALPELDQKATQALIYCFECFLRSEPEHAKQFIRQFYCDPFYQFGVYQLHKYRQEIRGHLHIELEPFSQAFPQRNIPDGHINFLLKYCPDYLPLTDLFESLAHNFNVCGSDWPTSYYFTILKLRVEVLADVNAAVKAIADLAPYSRTYSVNRSMINASAVAHLYAAQQARDIQIFSPEFYEFMQSADKHDAIRDVCHSLWKRADFTNQVMNPDTPVNIPATAIATLYLALDSQLSWPQAAFRDRFSHILLKSLHEGDSKERESAIELLLFRTFPISDMHCTQELIKSWVAIQKTKFGRDDNSQLYRQKLSLLISKIHQECPSHYAKDLLESLSVAIQTQYKLSEFIDQLFTKSQASERDETFNARDKLVMIVNVMAKEKISQAIVQFLCHELTQQSLNMIVKKLSDKARRALSTILSGHHGDINDQQAEVLIIFFYHSFWGLSIEERAVIINNLLLPSSSVTTVSDATRAYQEALNYLLDQLFPEKTDENNLSAALLESYLLTSNEYTRPYLLAAVLSANRLTAGKQRCIATVLPKLAEALGAAGVKAGQAANSYPYTPLHLRLALESLKSQSRLPYRWELSKLLKKAVPSKLFSSIKSMQNLLGGASFYLAVKVVMQNGDIRVLRLLRENAKEEAKYGFEHLRATLVHCTHEGIQSIADDLGSIILEAKKGAQIEIDDECARRQYDIATAIYSRDPVTIRVNNDEYHINIKAVTLHEVGDGYQLIDLASGIEFNDLKKQPDQAALCQAVARAVYLAELENMLAGRPFDADRHGAQARIICKEMAPGRFEVTVVNYDFGEIPPAPPTAAQLRHCQNFINELSRTLFSSSNLVYCMIGSLDTTRLTEQLTQQMLAYIKRYDNVSQDNDDLARLRGMFKGLLALNDYFEVIPKTSDFLLAVNRLFSRYAESSSTLSSVLGMFSGAMDWYTNTMDIELANLYKPK